MDRKASTAARVKAADAAGRRPRRGERSRPDLNDDAGVDEAGGLAQTLARGVAPERNVAPEPVAEESGDTGPKLIDADN